MGRNVIDHKNVKVREKLYNEILNGFQYDGGSISTKEKISSIRKERIKNVGKEYAKIKESYVLHNKFLNYLIKSPAKQYNIEIIDTDNDEEDVDEKEIKRANIDIWDVLIKINTVYRWWQHFKFVKQTYDISKSEIDQFKSSTNAEKHIKIDRYRGVFNTYLFETIDSLLQPVILALSEATINLYNSKKIQNVFEMLKEKQQTMKDHYERQAWLNGISMVASFVPVVGQTISAITTVAGILENVYYNAVEVGSWTGVVAAVGGGIMDVAACALPGGRAVTGLAKMGMGAKIAIKAAGKLAAATPMMIEMGMMVKDALEYTVEDEAEVREEIHTELMPKIYSMSDRINQDIYGMGRRLENGLAEGESLLLSTVEHRVTEAVAPADVRNRLREIREANEEARRNSPTEVEMTRPPTVSVRNQNFPEVSWTVSASKRRVQASFLRRFNIDVQGEIPEIRTSESESIRTLNAAFVFYNQNVSSMMQEIAKPIMDIEEYKKRSQTVEYEGLNIYKKNKKEKYTFKSRIASFVYFKDAIFDFQERLDRDYSVQAERIYQMRLKHKNDLQTLMRERQRQIYKLKHPFAPSYHSMNDWDIHVDFTSNQRFVPIFDLNGAIKALRFNVKIYWYEGEDGMIFDGTQPNNYIQLFKQGAPLSDSSYAIVTDDEYRFIDVMYKSYYDVCDYVWGEAQDKASIKSMDNEEYELENSINENVENLRKTILTVL